MADLKKLAIVVGAGASKEFGLPIGKELKQSISSLLNIKFEHGFRQISGDDLIMQAFRHLSHGGDANAYLRAAWRVRDALPQTPSIDQYIHTQRGNKLIEACGKLAIARAILQAERKSSLYIKRETGVDSIDLSKTQETWLNALFRVVIDGCTESDLDERFSTLSLIVFNYDRCIEHYLYHALRNYYKVDQTRAAALIARIKIYHPYGSVGDLPWQNQAAHIDFGSEPSLDQLLTLHESIKTFTEGTDPNSSEMALIRASLGIAPRVLFLGFAFNSLNLALLQPHTTPIEGLDRRVLATAIGLSNADCSEIRQELSANLSCAVDRIELRNDTSAYQIFGEYTRALAFDSFAV